MMPMLDVFAPDINSVSARSVYPTAGGGSTASAAGGLSQNTNVMVTSPSTGESGVATQAGTGVIDTSGKSLWWWVGVVGLLLATVFIGRKAGGPEDFRNIRPTFYNFLAITLTAIVGIVGLKVIFTRYRVAGLSDVILSA